jgi:hypothetical protein
MKPVELVGTGDRQLLQIARRRSRQFRRLGHDADRRRKTRSPGTAARDPSLLLRRHCPTMAGLHREGRKAGSQWRDIRCDRGRCSDPHRLRAADDMQVLLGLSCTTHAGAAKLSRLRRKFLHRSSQFRHSIRKADSGRLSVMRQRSRAIEQSPSCGVARWMPIRARRGVFGSASSVAGGESR